LNLGKKQNEERIYTKTDTVYKSIMSVLSVRIDKELEEKLKFLMEKQKIVDKSAYIRKLLDESIEEELLDFLSKEIEKKQISIWKAAELAKIPLRRMMHELAKRDVKTYDEAALQEDLDFVKKEG
jgi:predicted HTH domain antitoxin